MARAGLSPERLTRAGAELADEVGFDQVTLSCGSAPPETPRSAPRGKLTLTVIRAELSRIVRERAADDPNLHYLDGLDLYGEQDAAELPLPDDLHPDAATHLRMGERFAEHAFADGGPFGM